MDLEQVIGGVNGNVNAQAIQLRMRSAGQNLVSQSRIKVRDAAGLNPILILDLTTNVTNGVAGDRVLITSSAFQTLVSPVQPPDFTMASLIPASYLAAGSSAGIRTVSSRSSSRAVRSQSRSHRMRACS